MDAIGLIQDQHQDHTVVPFRQLEKHHVKPEKHMVGLEKMDVVKMEILTDIVMMNVTEVQEQLQWIHHHPNDVMTTIHHHRNEALIQNVVAQNLADTVEVVDHQFHVHAQIHTEISNY